MGVDAYYAMAGKYYIEDKPSEFSYNIMGEEKVISARRKN